MSKIMIVDDSEITLELTRQALVGAGHEVVALQSPLGLTAALYRQRPDLLLIDVDMPALSGVKVTQLVKANKRFEETRVILYSSRSPEQLSADVKSCGADGFVQKSGNAADLVTELEKVLSGQAALG